jgi:hypothetical protein
VPKNKDLDDLNKFIDKVEEEYIDFGEGIANGVFQKLKGEYQNLKNDAKKNITNNIIGAITGRSQTPTTPPQPNVPQAPARETFRKQPNPQIILKSPGLVENLGWFYGGSDYRPIPFTLSAQTDHFTYSNFITKINPGEYWQMFFRILDVGVGGEFSHAIEFLTVTADESNESGWVWSFADGKDEIRKASLKVNNQYTDHNYTLNTYRPDQINEILLIHDGKVIGMQLNRQDLRFRITVTGLPMYIKTRVVGMSASFWS